MHKAGWNGRHLIKIWYWKIVFSKILNSIYSWDLAASELETLPILLYLPGTLLSLPHHHTPIPLSSGTLQMPFPLPGMFSTYLLIWKIPTHLFIISSPCLGPSLTSSNECRWVLWASLALCAESRFKIALWQHVWISCLNQSPELRKHAFPSLYPNASHTGSPGKSKWNKWLGMSIKGHNFLTSAEV